MTIIRNKETGLYQVKVGKKEFTVADRAMVFTMQFMRNLL
jgi:hypothetical protein